jgi:hypothetical protein
VIVLAPAARTGQSARVAWGGMTAETVLRLVREMNGVAISLEGPCEGGETGAYFGRLPTGERLVFKWSENPNRLGPLRVIADALSALHTDAYPLPSYGPVLPFDGGVLIAQAVVGGGWSDVVADELGRALLACRRFLVGRAVAIADEPWGRFIIRTLTEGGDGYALHEPLRAHDNRTREVLDWIESVGWEAREADFHDGDLVHFDFHHRNVLQDLDGLLIAVVDWEGVRQGDSAFDLVTLAFGLVIADCTVELVERTWEEAIAATSGTCLRAYVAHMALRRLDWTIRFHPQEVDYWVNVCHDYIGRCSAV